MIARRHDTSYLSVGAHVDQATITARPGQVVIAMRSDTWPTAGLHLTPALGQQLLEELPAALALAEQLADAEQEVT